MSEINETGAPEGVAETTTPAVDPLKNFKAEMDRKLGNLEAQNAQLQAFIASLNQPKPDAQPTKKVSVFEDEEAYARRVADEAEARIMQRLERQNAEVTKKQSTIQALVNEYPELSDINSEMSRRAVEIFEALPADEKSSPAAYRAAVKEAAADLGLKPKAKRSQSNDSFSLGGSGAPVRAPKKEALPDGMADLAKAFGLELTPDRKERLATKHGRKSYKNFE